MVLKQLIYTRPYIIIRIYSNCAYELTRALVMYYTPILYCVYALVGGAISIRDPYICAVHQCVPTNRTCCLPQARCLCSENVAIGFKTRIEDYFVGKTAIGRWSCSRLAIYAITFERNVYKNRLFLNSFPYCDESVGVSLL